IERAKGSWDAERKYQADLRRIEQGNRDRHRAVHRAHADERRSESDDEVRGQIPLCGASHKGMYAEPTIMRTAGSACRRTGCLSDCGLRIIHGPFSDAISASG